MTGFRRATADYEKWLGRQIEIVPEDLRRKHAAMREGLFPFLRATFYRWAQLWPETVPACAEAPRVLAVGDLHVENFGTWRDAEGRLVWGINDFDEACPMPYTIDLVRLATSSHLAIEADRLRIAQADACTAILEGYRAGLESGGQPWVMAGRHLWLYEMVGPSLRDPRLFWEKLTATPDFEGRIPSGARRGIRKLMPQRSLPDTIRWIPRVAGMGSLGRQRFVGLAEYKGGMLAREAKALATSAWYWANPGKQKAIQYQKALDTAVRDLDPFVRLEGDWIVRRLAPDCAKINLAQFPQQKDEHKLLHAMGFETANCHLGFGRTVLILKDLAERKRSWLHDAATRMKAATVLDFKEWSAGGRFSPPVPERTHRRKD
jgi:hypothetical protein